jgi:hypothetical protein
MTYQEYWQDCEQEFQCWRMYGYLVETLQDSVYVEDVNNSYRIFSARQFRKGQVFHMLYSSLVEDKERQLAMRYVNDIAADTMPWWIYYDLHTSTKH